MYLQVDVQIQKAFEQWSTSTNLNFQAKSKGSVHIEIRFERKESSVIVYIHGSIEGALYCPKNLCLDLTRFYNLNTLYIEMSNL